MSPLPKIPQQGDAQRLAQVASGLKREGGTYGAVVQRNPTGRPQGSTGTPAPRASQQQAPKFQVSENHQQSFDRVARMEWTRQFWSGMRQRFPDIEWVQDVAANADKLAADAAEAAFQSTPNFEY